MIRFPPVAMYWHTSGWELCLHLMRKQRKGAEEGIEAPGWKEHLERKDDPLFELHLFNDQEEYRFFQKQDGKFAEFVVSENDQPKGIYVEDMCVEKRYADVLRKIRVVNYIDYTEDGMLEIVNYRLSPVPEEEC